MRIRVTDREDPRGTSKTQRLEEKSENHTFVHVGDIRALRAIPE